MQTLCHHFNALHVYCLLRKAGFKKARARKLSRAWERVVHPIIY